MLDFVPLAGARRQMVDLDPEPGLKPAPAKAGGKLLQFTLPQTDARTIAAAPPAFAGAGLAVTSSLVAPG